MQKKDKKSGFTLVEIMIVVAIIGLLAAIAVPSFVSARENTQEKSCINNLRQIDGAKAQWALENGATATDTPSIANDLTNEYLAATPACPIGKTAYVDSAVGVVQGCPNNGNTHLVNDYPNL